MASPKFTWNKEAQRFRYSSGEKKGQFVSKATVRSLMNDFIDDQKIRSDRITASFLGGGLTLAEWEDGMAKRIKALHSTAYLLGKGGTLRYDSSIDRGRIGNIVKEEYRFLRGFSEAIRDGKLSKAQIRARARSYMAAAYKTEQRAEEISHQENGYAYEQNILGAGESCPDCIYFAGLGVVPIGSTPPVGVGRQCGNNCQCHKDYSVEAPEGDRRLLAGWGWAA